MSNTKIIVAKFFSISFVCLLASFSYSIQLQRHAQVETIRPIPPPTVDPGPEAATLNLRIVGKKTRTEISATVSVNKGRQEAEENYSDYSLRHLANRHKGPIRFRQLDYYFFTDGALSVKVPPGKCTVEVRRGYEYIPSFQTFQLEANQVMNTTISLSHWIDMSTLGWYSGDTHIHFNRTSTNDESLLTLTSARDIRYAFSLSMNTRGYSLGRKEQAFGLGNPSSNRIGHYFLSSGQEYRTRSLGHVTIVMGRDYVPGIGYTENTDQGPSLGIIADQARELGGFVGLNHGGYTRMEADSLILNHKIDFLELLQFGGYRGLGLDGWYDFLNLGYRLPIAGASDFPYTRELGDSLTYVQFPYPPTPREFIQGLAKGRSFATTGPMLMVTVNGKSPGESILENGNRKLDLEVEIQVSSPLYPVRYIDLIQNGRVVARNFASEGKTNWELSHRIEAISSGWVAARAHSDAGTEAHTNPVYIYLDEKLPFDDDACGQVLARLDSSLHTISEKSVVKAIRTTRNQLAHYCETGDPKNLGLPSITEIRKSRKFD